MDMVRQQIDLLSLDRSDARVPPTELGEVLRLIQPTMVSSVRMAVEGRSSSRGRRPRWLDAATDIRLTDVDMKKERTSLHFDSPSLGSAAPELYEQHELWRTGPAPEATAFDLFSSIIKEIGDDDRDSDSYDIGFLKRLGQFAKGLGSTYASLSIEKKGGRPARVDHEVLERAAALRDATPPPRPIRIAGELDMLRASTDAFSLILDDGSVVMGTVTEGLNIEDLSPLFKKRILIHARAVYRPSGRLLRLDAEAFEDGADAQSFWSRVPGPLRRDLKTTSSTKPRVDGLGSSFGTWPGEETEQELLDSLAELG